MGVTRRDDDPQDIGAAHKKPGSAIISSMDLRDEQDEIILFILPIHVDN